MLSRVVETGPGWEIRCGRWQDVLVDVVECDAVICDPPYSARTHEGALSSTLEVGVSGYAPWTAADASGFCRWGGGIARSWVVVHTDDVLSPVIREAMDHVGRYTFASVPVLQHMPRISGDGPGSPGHLLCVSRPKEKRFAQWGSLPGWYECPRDGSNVRGGKPLGLMRAIVRDYTKPGDLVVDPFCGGGTTALACVMEGRRCITSECDPKTFALAVKRLRRGFTTDLFTESEAAK